MPPKQQLISRAPAAATSVGAPRKYGDLDDSDYVHDEIKELGRHVQQHIARMNPRANESQLLEHLRQFGPSEHSKLQMRKELAAAEHSIATGVYIVYRNVAGTSGGVSSTSTSSSSSAALLSSKARASGAQNRVREQECCRVGPQHKCFCGHSLTDHQRGGGGAAQRQPTAQRAGGSALPPCALCNCAAFEYIPNMPEEVGDGHLSKRRGFVAELWSAKCRCGHGSAEHDPASKQCRACRGCFRFDSHFLCGTCDARWEDHATLVETEAQRRAQALHVGSDYLPLSEVDPEFRSLVFGEEVARRLPPGSRQQQQQQQQQSAPRALAQRPGGNSNNEADDDSFLSAFPSKATERARLGAGGGAAMLPARGSFSAPSATGRVQEVVEEVAPPAPAAAPAAVAGDSAQQKTCGACGVINRRLAKFCRGCGAGIA